MTTVCQSVTNVSYSAFNSELMELLQNNEKLQSIHLETNRDDVVDFMRHYNRQYSLSPWPIFINQNIVKDFEHFIRNFPAIVYKAINLFFKNDTEAFSRYLNEPAIVHQLLSDHKPDVRDLCLRHDIIFADNQFKLIEVNAGSTIGGWQHDWLTEVYQEYLEQAEFKNLECLKYRPVSIAMLAAAADSIVRLKGNTSNGNLLLFDTEGKMGRHLQGLYETVKPASIAEGKIYHFNDFEQLKFDANENVVFDGKIMDAVMLTLPEDVAIPHKHYLRLVSSHLKKRIVFPDSPFQSIVGNKLILALLHEESVLSMLDSTEREIVTHHVPWTVKLEKNTIIWKQQKTDLKSLLLENKDLFVLKKAKSFQGRDVIVGKFTQQEDWCQSVEQFKSDGDWLVQAYCKPDQVQLCNPSVGINGHELVWGIFDFNSSYQGAFVRAMPNKKHDAIINSANGATEFTVFEEFKPKKKIII